MTSYSLFPGNGPSTGTAYATGDLVEGTAFGVTSGGLWLNAYRVWILPTVQTLTGYKFSLYQVTGAAAGSIIPNSTVVAGPLTAGAWNLVPLAAPLLLSPAFASDTLATTFGSAYMACIGNTTAAWGAFPETKNIFGTGDSDSGGISNGPLFAFSSSSGSNPVGGTAQWVPQMAFTTSIADPSAGMPTQNDSDANLWLDLLLSTLPPASPSYRMLPNMPVFTGPSPQALAYTLGTPFIISQPHTLDEIWHYSPPTATILPSRCGIWNTSTQTEVAGTDNSAPSWSGAAGSGWVSCSYAGVTLPAGSYVASTFTSNNTATWFLAETGWYSTAFPTGIVQGTVTYPGPSVYNLGAVWTYPATTNTEYDGVDVRLTPVSAPAVVASFPVSGHDDPSILSRLVR